MGAIIASDVSITAAGAIRWTGTATTNRHTVLEFIQFLMDKQDDAQAAGDDLLDITVDTPFNRSTDQILTLNSPFNIDDTFALHLYDGSVVQTTNGGETRWSGLNIIGPVETGTEYMILQNGKVLPSFWGTGINPEASPSLVFSRHLIKSKVGGAEIDGARITVLARELGDQFRRFAVTLGTGNSVAAIGNGSDIFNAKVEATLAGYTTITNVEGFQEIDIDGTGASGQEYYSQWNKAALAINDVYERSKWISQRAHVTDLTTTAAGNNRVVENATIVGQGQSFIPLSGTEKLTEARLQIKNGGGTPTGTLYCELWDSNDAGVGTAVPTGASLARSEDVLASHITSTYEEVIFRFNRYNPTTGVDQLVGLDLANAEYFMVLRNDAGDGSNFFHVDSASSSTDATQGSAVDTSGTWGTASVNDIQLTVKSSPVIHGLPGEIFQGINIDVGFDAEAGTGIIEDTILMWGTKVTYDGLASGPFRPGEQLTFKTGSTLKAGGEVLYDDGVDEILVSLDTQSALTDDDIISTVRGSSETTAVINATIVDDDKSGGEGILLAWDDNTGSGEAYIQVISGNNPVDNNLLRVSDLTEDPLVSYLTATSTIVTRTINPEFLGTSTGSNIIGTYGIGFELLDVGASDRFTSLDDSSRTPPNNVIFTVSGLISGEDRVLVGPRTGSALDVGQWQVSTTLNDGIAGTPEVTLVIKTGTDTVPVTAAKINHPTTGIGAGNSRLRIKRDDGIYARIPYDSFATPNFTLGTPDTGVTNLSVVGNDTFTRAAGSFLDDGFEKGCVFATTGFTTGTNNSTYVALSVTATGIVPTDTTDVVTEAAGSNEQIQSTGWEFNNGDSSTDTGNATANNQVFLAYIDVLADATSETFTGVHTSSNDRTLFVRVRDGGGTPIKTFESSSAQFLSTAQTVAAIRTSDA
ncbi:hypothetical protein COB55_03475 [Candidatus Wolfebacteria bacterium]|nr:MAG: hypothetical protein COB55_03475 [Candidatus Wolfebacteria bacterium]